MKMPYLLLAAIITLLSNSYTRQIFSHTDVALGPLLTIEFLVASDAESVLARGEKLALSKVDQFDLELIPGMSSSIAEEILEHREELLLSPHLVKGLKQIHGIGEKKANSFVQYLRNDEMDDTEEEEGD